ncbi:hypothetical protein BJ165DRAFT_1370639 [Panaeolus papilionaceus]|nr:hypothetical protein BJ165DRAFT_1370639 [Panaeolus papilionaceus]
MTQTWTSRNHRKHRYVTFSPDTERRRHAESFWDRIANMRRLEYWNVSWWVAQAFTWGSVAWCINGFAAWLPFVQTKLAKTLILTGWTAFLGATIFEIGSIFGILEAWNRDDTTSFGWSIKSALHHRPGEVVLSYWGNLSNPNPVEEHMTNSAGHKTSPEDEESQVHVAERNAEQINEKQGRSEGGSVPRNIPGDSSEISQDAVNHGNHDPENPSAKNHNANFSIPPVQRISSEKHAILQVENTPGKRRQRRWIWFSADPHYFYELGFLAAFFQLAGATIFWISGFTAIPSIQEALMERVGAWKGAFWVPQVVGGSGFIISSTFVMLESQDVWYKPKLFSLGWHVGLWNFIGGVGFTACGALGYFSLKSTGVAYQSALCTFWGSWAFLIGSLIQWYESVNAVHD